MIIVITHAGRTTEHSLVMEDVDLDDAYIRSLAEEIRDMPRGTLDHFVVDRMPAPEGAEVRLYVRPKVPFGSSNSRVMQAQLEVAVEALLQYSTSATSGLRAQQALAQIAEMEMPS